MNLPQYWARETHEATDFRGERMSLSCWRWSNVSIEDARRRAKEHLVNLARKVRDREELHRYDYGELPLREEIVQVVAGNGGEQIAAITRNAYGTLVLNAARAMFIDIDFEPSTAGLLLTSLLGRLFGSKPLNREERALQALDRWAREHRDWGMRVYRTAAGLRCLATHRPFDPAQPATLNLLESIGSDPLYVRLCRAQQCFRARLTPKPWRCGIAKPASRFPWVDSRDEARYRRWVDRYNQATARYATCRLVREVGPTAVHPDVQPVLSLHDQVACNGDHLKLA